ncbi:MAG TPA: hypothetical protein VEY95_13970, partial [Azospirillaceae bacterium]|nr:hypothetical protein [Azospirillaceae bacterium]
VADTIVALAERPRREVFVGNSGRMLALQRMLAPGLAERMMARLVDRQHFFQDHRAETASGNLFEPMAAGRGVGGCWRAPARKGEGRAMAWGLGALLLGIGAAALAGSFARAGREPVS